MKLSLKKVSKKALALLLTVAMMFSALSVAFTAFADAPIYTVPDSKPAIPAQKGTVIDLSKIGVQFGDNTYLGADLTWAPEDDSTGVVVNDTAKTIAYMSSDICAVIAKNEVTGERKSIYILETDATGVATIYDHIFTANDLQTNATTGYGEFKPSSEWKAYKLGYTGSVNIHYISGGIVDTNLNSSGHTTSALYLDPNSTSGKRVADFPYMTFEVKGTGFNGGSGEPVGAYLYLNPSDDGVIDSTTNYLRPVFWVRAANATNGLFRLYNNAGTILKESSSSKPVTNNAGFKLRFTVSETPNGDQFLTEADVDNDNIYTDLTSTYTAVNLAQKGTIGLYSYYNIRPYFSQVTVTAQLDNSKAHTGEDGYLISIPIIEASKPAIPMQVGKKLDVSNIGFEFDDGTVVLGSQIEWTADKGVVVNNENSTIALFGSDIYAVTASYKDGTDDDKTFYVFEPEADNTKEIFRENFNKNFDIAALNANTHSIWKAVTGSASMRLTSAKDSTLYYGISTQNNGYATIYVDPTSAAGKLVSAFKDYNIDLGVKTHDNYNTTTVYGTPIGVIARMEIPETGFGFATSHNYAISWFRPSNTDYQNIYLYYNYDTTAGRFIIPTERLTKSGSYAMALDINFSYKFKGDNFSMAWASADNSFTGSYDSALDTNLTDENKALLAASNQKNGTVGIRINANSRSYYKSISVTIELDQTLIDALEPSLTDIIFIPADKPAIPMQVGKKLDVSDIYFAFDDGSVKLGKDITWTLENKSQGISVSDSSKMFVLLNDGVYDVTAKQGAEGPSKDFYVLQPDATGVATIYDHTFISSDLDGEGGFKTESEWKAYSLTADVSANLQYSGGVYAGNSASVALYLDPDSVSGKRVTSFPDYTIIIKSPTAKNTGSTCWVGPYLRLNLGTEDKTDTPVAYSKPCFIARNNTAFLRNYYATNGTETNNGSNYATSTTTPLIIGAAFSLRYTINGKTITAASDVGNDGTYETSGSFTYADLPAKGTIGLFSENIYSPVFSRVTVTAQLDTNLINAVSPLLTDVVYVPISKPAIPMNIGQVLHLDDINLVANDGTLIFGKDATWTISDNQVYVEKDDTHKTITAFSSGYCTLTATDADDNSAVVYLTVANTKGEYVIYNHNFSANDLRDAGGYNVFTTESEWYAKNLSVAGGENLLRLGWEMVQANNAQGWCYGGLTTSYSNSGSDPSAEYYSLVYLRPDSASGKKVSSFADITLDYSATYWGNSQNERGPYLRLQFDKDEDGSFTTTPVSYVNPSIYYRTATDIGTCIRIYDTTGKVYGWDSISYSDETEIAVLHKQKYWHSIAINGDDFTVKVASDANYSDAFTADINANGGTTVTSHDGKTATKATSAYELSIANGGTIGFKTQLIGPIGLYDVVAKITFSADEMALFANFIEDYSDLKVTYYEDISQYRGEVKSAPAAPYGKVFAGWFTNEECTEAIDVNATTGGAYAKFVSTSVFGVKWQITNPALDRNSEKAGTQVDMRLVSSLDNTKYNRVGFKIVRSDNKTAELFSDTVYEQITGEFGNAIYDPMIFSTISKYFITVNLTDMKWEDWGEQPFTVTTVIETKDGTIVYNNEATETFKPCYDDLAIDLKANNLKAEINAVADLNPAEYDHVYYVAANGNNSNDGSINAPFASVEYAVETVVNNITDNSKTAILLRRGDTFRVVNNITIKVDNVSIGAYGDSALAKPKIYGAYDALNTLTPMTQAPTFTESGLNPTIEIPEGLNLWTINMTKRIGNTTGWIDIGAIYFVKEDGSVIVGDKKWNRADGVGEDKHYLYREEYDKLTGAYDFFYDYDNRTAYVLLPDDIQNLSDHFTNVEIPTGDHTFETEGSNTVFRNLDIRYSNFGIVVWDEEGVRCEGLEIGWIGGARNSNCPGDFETITPSDYTRLGNGIEFWGSSDDSIIDHCYVYECYDAGITFQENAGDEENEVSTFSDITFSNNLLERNVYNIEYFLSHEADDGSYMENILFDSNICRDAGGTQNDVAWGAAYRPDKGVASHIKGATTQGNYTVLDANGKSTFVIKNNIFDGAINSVLGVSAQNEGGEPIFQNNMYVQHTNEEFRVNGTKYSADSFKDAYDTNGDFVARQALTSRSVYASARTYNSWGKVETVDNLNNTLYNLRNGSIKVGYIGGSVTAGTGATAPAQTSYRARTSQWLRDTYNATVIETNAAWGGTGSYWGYFRMNEQLLTSEQDLVFIEFAINDTYAGLTDMESALYMEGIIKKIRANNPYTDIVIVFITDQSHLGQDFSNLLAHKAVAEHYGIPTINVGAALANEITANSKTWADYSDDIVHPKDDGHAIYANAITAYLGTTLTGEATNRIEHEIPAADYVSNQATSSEIVTVDRISNYNGFTKKEAGYTTFVDEAFYGSSGANLSYYFNGKTVGLFLSKPDKQMNTVTLKATIDGKETVTKTFKGGDCREMTLVDNLSNGSHSVKIEIIEGGEIAIGGLLISK